MLLFFPIVNIVMLSAFLYARFARGETFDLLAGCDAKQSQYTPLGILFGRPASRPLIRGESKAIASIRAVILFSLCLVIPAFGIYVMVVVPITGQVFTRGLKLSNSWYDDPGLPYLGSRSQDNIVIPLVRNCGPLDITISMTIENETQRCVISSGFAECPFPWGKVPADGLLLSANFSAEDMWGILYVKAGEGSPSDVDAYSEPIPLAAGSHLAAILHRTERQIFSNAPLDLLGITTPMRKVILRPMLLLQEDRMPPNSGSDTVSLRLRPRGDISASAVTEIVQDYADASFLNGFASFGGLWTFLNGAFSMLFGAEIVYFLFRGRPLSALGLVHFFQRRALMRRWHEDFPALRTEGGQPGSEAAGIVAFIRERFVDVDDERPKVGDVEPQKTSIEDKYQRKETSRVEVESDREKIEEWEFESETGGTFAYLPGIA
ncbi:hypothetical protein B0H19DRAFT_1309812 [Mycena capillaripes]|nr:hypothetical protein B0H19DRAFT_1309812 [Mycena capillaripes]